MTVSAGTLQAAIYALADRGRQRASFVHTDITIGQYGTSIVLRDAPPIDAEDENGDEVDAYPGKVITCGAGPDLVHAIAAANAALDALDEYMPIDANGGE